LILSRPSELEIRDDTASSAVCATKGCGEEQLSTNAFRVSDRRSFLIFGEHTASASIGESQRGDARRVTEEIKKHEKA